ncbi:LysE/ArgO family amino acid transporter [Curtobacterium sp. 'Ferrero']|uniref:LysE/ArgO family amino acid transporter n=1 Tax=Curtobacterium sp. 'Ferrero' TaxID=2033654 RepID=UPI0020D1D313|nr:LysE family transporter [Curtobacterium sp. 'Ferrero']
MLLPLLAGLGTGLALIVAIGAQNAYLLRLAVSASGRVVVVAVLVCAASDAVLILAGVLGVGAVVERFPVALVVVRFVGAAFLVTYGVLAARRALRPTDEALRPDDAGSDTVTADGAARSARDTVAPPKERCAPSLRGALSARGRDDTAAAGTAAADTAAAGTAAAGNAATAAPPAQPTTLPTRAERTRRTVPPGRPATMRTAVATMLVLTWANPHVYLDTLVFLGSVANQQGPVERWPWTVGAILASCTWFGAVGFGGQLLRPLFAKPLTWRVFDGLVAVVMLGFGIALVVGA